MTKLSLYLCDRCHCEFKVKEPDIPYTVKFNEEPNMDLCSICHSKLRTEKGEKK